MGSWSLLASCAVGTGAASGSKALVVVAQSWETARLVTSCNRLLVFLLLLSRMARMRILGKEECLFSHKLPLLLAFAFISFEFCLLSLAKLPIEVFRQTGQLTRMHHGQVLFRLCHQLSYGKKIYLSIFKIHVMLPITKTESLQLLKFSKLPLI